MATTFWPPTPFGRGASRGRIPLGRDRMHTGITSTFRVGSTGCRVEGPTPVVIRFPPRTQRRWWVRTRARSAVHPSQAASTPRRLSWSPCGEWQRLLAGPLAGYRGSPRMSREGTTDWLWPISRVGVRASGGTARPNDPHCHTASKGTLPPEPWVGTHRIGGPEWGHPRPRRSGRGRPAVGNPAFPR